MDEPRDAAARRERLVALCRALPEAEADGVGAGHIAFKVRGKIFAYYLYDHHGDGRIAFVCKAAPGEQERLVRESPRRYFVPPYVGPKGWVGFRLDTPRVAWREARNLAGAAYVLTAPASLRGQTASSAAPKRRRRT